MSSSSNIETLQQRVAELEQQLGNVAELRKDSRLLEGIFRGSPLATIEIDGTGTMQRWNDAATRIFGWTADETIGQSIMMVVPPNLIDDVQLLIEGLARGSSNESLNDNITKDGRIITCQWHNAPVFDADDNVAAIVCQAEDVTQKVQSEQQLRVFYALASNAPDFIGTADRAGTITYANAAFVRGMGGDPDDLAANDGILTVGDIVVEADRTRMQQVVQRSFDGESLLEQVTFRRGDGTTFVGECSLFPILDRNDQPVQSAVIVRDISDKLRDAAEREQMQQQMISIQRDAIRELSTPLIPLANNVVAMPIIGTIDATRSQQILETLLEGIAAQQAEVAILDITGVRSIDTQVASSLMKTAQAVRLLGAQVILSGISPEIASTLVHLGVDLSEISTSSTLQSAIATVLEQNAPHAE